MSTEPPVRGVAFGDALKVWFTVGWLSFGGPAAQIALMHRLIVEERRWIDEKRFLHALNYCMLLPGPEAQQLATYIGWLLHRTVGGLAAGLMFILPGFFVILGLSVAYSLYQDAGWFGAVFFGIKAAVLAVVVQAVVRLGKRALKNAAMVRLAAAAFIAIFFFHVPFPLIVIGAALLGFYSAGRPAKPGADDSADDVGALDRVPVQPTLARTLSILAIGLTAWWAPIAMVYGYFGAEHVLTQQAWFFSKMAVLTFGGAYAVLSYMAQAAVETYGWLQPGEMIDGLGLAESTPGPLIMVTEFVGFLAAARHMAELSPIMAGVAGAVLTTWVTFVPCFLWILLGAPYVEKLRENRRLSAALNRVTAAVVGVIVNLSLWFALHVVFEDVGRYSSGWLNVPLPDWRSFNVAAAILVGVALPAVLKFRVGILKLIAGFGCIGLARYYLF